ncbi:NAD(P)H-hydrate dehydratase [Lactobacillus sp. DCY120]|uniref:ADP-dependent (S)-NAD(P)H-hydrate dehydratase n=1 Tax=Bombilactobacillus apium TaxID=2675299 RepID=A0A850R833_9LACO|nr:NAD(P)H-hydrate dehydratase [Bombilactobacillus apium]NVY96862.1 NAD(P)H-hydrate dehydratase [Bombilactobacillus apium]
MEKLTENILTRVITRRPLKSHKGTFGKVLLVAGSAELTGAAILSTMACVYTGAGLVTLATARVNFNAVHTRIPEAMVLDLDQPQQVLKMATQVDVLAVGPGLAATAASRNLIQKLILQAQPQQQLIIDATAFTLLAEKPQVLSQCAASVVLTPHPVEWQRLTGLKINQQTASANQRALDSFSNDQTILVLKGAPTHLYLSQRAAIYINTLGTPAMATGGMGDTLTGILAGFTAQFEHHWATAAAAVYLHSWLAEQLALTSYVVLPTQVIQKIPWGMQKFAQRD